MKPEEQKDFSAKLWFGGLAGTLIGAVYIYITEGLVPAAGLSISMMILLSMVSIMLFSDAEKQGERQKKQDLENRVEKLESRILNEKGEADE